MDADTIVLLINHVYLTRLWLKAKFQSALQAV